MKSRITQPQEIFIPFKTINALVATTGDITFLETIKKVIDFVVLVQGKAPFVE